MSSRLQYQASPHFPDRRWSGRYEYYACIHHGAYKGDRCAHGARREAEHNPDAVCHRGNRLMYFRWHHWNSDRYLKRFLLGKVASLSSRICTLTTRAILLCLCIRQYSHLLSLFFSMLTGVFFGYYPANQGSKMEVIDALRYE